MSTIRSTRQPWHLLLVGAVIAHLLLAIAMAANHELHEWIHGDAGDEDHECVAQLLLHGGCDNTTADQPAPILVCFVCETLPPAVAADVPSVYLTGGVLEHAPPRRV